MSACHAPVEMLTNSGIKKTFSRPRYVLVCVKHNNGRTIILSGATALVSLESHRPGVEYRKYLLLAPTDTR